MDEWVAWKHEGQRQEKDLDRPQIAAACYQRAYDLLGRDPDGPGFDSDLAMAALLRGSAERCQAKWMERRRA